MNLQVSPVLHFQAVKPISSAHCERSTLRLDQSAGSETFNITETFWSLPTGNMTGIELRKVQTSSRNVWQTMQNCCRCGEKKMSFCLVSLVWTRPKRSFTKKIKSINHKIIHIVLYRYQFKKRKTYYTEHKSTNFGATQCSIVKLFLALKKTEASNNAHR